MAVSRVLDVMADHKVQDLDRILEHEPLSVVLSGLEDSSDPYLMYQTCYAFQALQYVPDDEPALRVVLRHSTDVVDSLVKITSALKLDQGWVFEGLEMLQEVALLGEIAVNTVWTATVRQQAADLLSYLYQDDQDWGHDESVKRWMVTILDKLESTSDQAVSKHTIALLQELNLDPQDPTPLSVEIPTSNPGLIFNPRQGPENLLHRV
ncbi:hypothetical protein BG015_000801 [Linnemannia schmuckeri]|uniref:Arm-like repeat domain-containing protein n=1 Tax=Linnemannia schmuckeri TaxID=64567 RepID=A0A9P5RQN0_9FUNG|nr:hypothetical protein BG015_000801 [Linnemannia schmuckeri]